MVEDATGYVGLPRQLEGFSLVGGLLAHDILDITDPAAAH